MFELTSVQEVESLLLRIFPALLFRPSDFDYPIDIIHDDSGSAAESSELSYKELRNQRLEFIRTKGGWFSAQERSVEVFESKLEREFLSHLPSFRFEPAVTVSSAVSIKNPFSQRVFHRTHSGLLDLNDRYDDDELLSWILLNLESADSQEH